MTHIRIFCVLAFFACAAFCHAAWENTHFCRLSEDRLLLSDGKQRFVLTHAAAWELADPAQKDAFAKWIKQTGLPKDLGQLVAGAPPEHEIPLAGELLALTDATGATTLVFKQQQTLSAPMKLGATVDGAKLDADGETEFASVAKKLGKPVSTLLVVLADKNGSLSHAEAWGAVLARLKARPEFFPYIDKNLGLLWVHHVDSLPSTAPPSNSAGSAPDSGDGSSTPAEKEKPSEPLPLLPILVGVGALIVGVGGGYWLGSRKTPEQAPVPAPAPKFNVSANERELIEKVRDEMRKLGWPANRVPSAEEVVVGQMLDRFNRFTALQEDATKLESYRQFKESHDLFQKKIDVAQAEAAASVAKSAEMAELLKREQAKSASLAGDLGQANAKLASATSELQRATLHIKNLERSNVDFQQAYAELVNRTAAVCHDMVLTRPRGDAWALAFVYLVDYTLAYLGLARQCNDQATFDAMLTNLGRLSEAMAKSFPDRKLVVDPWRRAVKAFGEIKAPAYDQKPHPHVDSLSQILLTVRDTGPSLGEFRELYAPSDGALHIIRPA